MRPFSFMTKRFEIDPRLKIIANHFGFQAQAEKAIEEMAELMVEIKHIEKRSETSAYDYVRFIEELADVKIMVDQLIYLTEKDAEDYFNVGEAIESKIQRTLKRIRNEYDVPPDAITARNYEKNDPETLKRLGIFD